MRIETLLEEGGIHSLLHYEIKKLYTMVQVGNLITNR
jgi:hypothetical protein